MQDANMTRRGQGITFCSWNVKGINEPIKRSKVLAHLNQIKTDIIFLQETHLKKESQHRLKAKWIAESYHSSFSHKSRGVAIVIRKGIPFATSSIIVDMDGRYIIVVGELNGEKVILLNVYGPNFDNPTFFNKTFNKIPEFAQYKLIIGGDFNCTLDPYLDRSSRQKKINIQLKCFFKFIY